MDFICWFSSTNNNPWAGRAPVLFGGWVGLLVAFHIKPESVATFSHSHINTCKICRHLYICSKIQPSGSHLGLGRLQKLICCRCKSYDYTMNVSLKPIQWLMIQQYRRSNSLQKILAPSLPSTLVASDNNSYNTLPEANLHGLISS